jgi:hypothetical protein
MTRLKTYCRQAGLPQHFCDLLTFHGFRSGGASDTYNEGIPVEMIMINGRWKSDCFRFYLHLRASAVQAVFERALAGGALTAHERLEESHWQEAVRRLNMDAARRSHHLGGDRRGAA